MAKTVAQKAAHAARMRTFYMRNTGAVLARNGAWAKANREYINATNRARYRSAKSNQKTTT